MQKFQYRQSSVLILSLIVSICLGIQEETAHAQRKKRGRDSSQVQELAIETDPTKRQKTIQDAEKTQILFHENLKILQYLEETNQARPQPLYFHSWNIEEDAQLIHITRKPSDPDWTLFLQTLTDILPGRTGIEIEDRIKVLSDFMMTAWTRDRDLILAKHFNKKMGHLRPLINELRKNGFKSPTGAACFVRYEYLEKTGKINQIEHYKPSGVLEVGVEASAVNGNSHLTDQGIFWLDKIFD